MIGPQHLGVGTTSILGTQDAASRYNALKAGYKASYTPREDRHEGCIRSVCVESDEGLIRRGYSDADIP